MGADADVEKIPSLNATRTTWTQWSVNAMRTKALIVRREDDGINWNKMQTFDAVGIDQPEADAFVPKPPGDSAGDDQRFR